MTYARLGPKFSTISSRSYCSSCLASAVIKERTRKGFNKVKWGLQKSIPTDLVLMPFRKIPNKQGLTSRRVINLLRRNYYLPKSLKQSAKMIGAMLTLAVEFGFLTKRGKKYFLKEKN